jgi:hypothetical protein
MKSPHHGVFRPADLEQDSCFHAIALANERFLQRHQAAWQEEGKLFSANDEVLKEQCLEPPHYEASDDDLPSIFFEPSSA